MKKDCILILLMSILFFIKTTQTLNKNSYINPTKITTGILYVKIAEYIANEKIPFSEITSNVISHYLMTFLTTLLHEFGHAIASKLLYQSNIDIHIGDNYQNKKPIIHFLGISIDGFNPKKGFSFLNRLGKNNRIKEGIIFLAGGVFGILVNIFFCFLYLLFKKYNNSQQTYQTPSIIYKLIFYQIFEMLIPITINGALQNNDAHQLYKKCFNVSDKNIKLLGKLTEPTFFGIIALSTLLGSKKTTPLSSKFLMILANFLLNEYVCLSL